MGVGAVGSDNQHPGSPELYPDVHFWTCLLSASALTEEMASRSDSRKSYVQ